MNGASAGGPRQPRPQGLVRLLAALGPAALMPIAPTSSPAAGAEALRPAALVMEFPPYGTGEAEIDGGTRQETSRWPATLRAYRREDGKLSCTATVVGERVLVTAGHCFGDDVTAELRLDGGVVQRLDCERHGAFVRDDLVADLAVCLTPEPMRQLPAFENLDLDPAHLPKGTSLFLVGYGCRSVTATAEILSGTLYGGAAAVDRPASVDGGLLTTRDGVVICPGDSGGAAYLLARAEEPGGPRSMVGVNSGFIPDPRTSFIAVFTPVMADFLKAWLTRNGVAACGLGAKSLKCRDAAR